MSDEPPSANERMRASYNAETRRTRPPRPVDPPFIIVQGYVREAGGGVVTIVVERDTDYYPPVGAQVAIVRKNDAR